MFEKYNREKLKEEFQRDREKSNKVYKLQMQRLLQAKTYAAQVQKGKKKKRITSNDYNRSTQVYNVRGGFW